MKALITLIFVCSFCITYSWGSDNLDNKLNYPDDEFAAMITNIYDLLQQGHPVDEVILLMNEEQKNVSDIRKLITEVQELLKNHNSPSVVINVVSNGNEAERYHKRKNFRANLKLFFELIKFVVICVIIYFLYYYASVVWYFIKKIIEYILNYIGLAFGFRNIFCVSKPVESTFASIKHETKEMAENGKRTEQRREPQAPAPQQDPLSQAEGQGVAVNKNSVSAENPESKPEPITPVQGDSDGGQASYEKPRDPLDPFVRKVVCDKRLIELLDKQAEVIQKLNIDPNAKHLDQAMDLAYLRTLPLLSIKLMGYTPDSFELWKAMKNEIDIRNFRRDYSWFMKRSMDLYVKFVVEVSEKFDGGVNMPIDKQLEWAKELGMPLEYEVK